MQVQSNTQEFLTLNAHTGIERSQTNNEEKAIAGLDI